MINFVVQNPTDLYRTLVSPRIEAEANRELLERSLESKVVEEIGSAPREFRQYDAGKIKLPNPLEEISSRISSNGFSYYGASSIDVSDHQEHRDIFKTLKNRILSDEHFNTLEFGKGIFFMNGGNTPLFNLNSSYPMFRFYFGKHGTAGRNLDNVEQFEADIHRFSEILSLVVNSAYTSDVPDIELPLFFS